MTEVALRKQIYGLSSHVIWDRLRLSDDNGTPPSYFRASAILLVWLQESKRVPRWGNIQWQSSAKSGDKISTGSKVWTGAQKSVEWGYHKMRILSQYSRLDVQAFKKWLCKTRLFLWGINVAKRYASYCTKTLLKLYTLLTWMRASQWNNSF